MKVSWEFVEEEDLTTLVDKSFPAMEKSVCNLSLEANAGVYPTVGESTIRQAGGKVVTLSPGTKISIQDTLDAGDYEAVDLSVLMVKGSVVKIKGGVTLSLLCDEEMPADGNGHNN